MSNNRHKNKAQLIREHGWTYEDYAALDDGNRYELVDGRLELMSPGPSVSHQWISSEMQFIIKQSCNEDFVILVSPIDLILSEREVRQPDLLLVHRSRLHILKKHGIVGVPDLVVEILSPSTIKRDKIDKSRTYAHFGVPEYWIVHSDASVLEQYMLDAKDQRYELVNIYQGDESIQSERLPCMSFTMNDIRSQVQLLD